MLRVVLTTCAAALVLTGCQAEISTRIDVSEQAQAQITVSAQFTGDAAVAMQYDPALISDLENLFTERGATSVSSINDEGRVEVSGTVSYDTLLASADVTGVQAAELDSRDGTARVTVTTQTPTALVEALTEQAAALAADDADAQALTQTFLATTQVAIVVTFPGTATATGSQSMQPFLTTDGTQVRFAAPLAEIPEGEFTAEGNLSAPMPWLRWFLALIALLVITVIIARRRGRST